MQQSKNSRFVSKLLAPAVGIALTGFSAVAGERPVPPSTIGGGGGNSEAGVFRPEGSTGQSEAPGKSTGGFRGGAAARRLTTSDPDGFALQLSRDGRPIRIAIGGEPIPLLDSEGGFYIRDMSIPNPDPNPPNLVEDPGFEDASNYWQSEHWKADVDSGFSGKCMFLDQQATASDSNWKHLKSTRRVPVDPNCSYLVSLRVRHEAANGLMELRIVEHQQSGSPPPAFRVPVPLRGATPWRQVNKSFATSESARALEILITYRDSANPSDTKIWIDDLSIAKRFVKPKVSRIRGRLHRSKNKLVQRAVMKDLDLRFKAEYRAFPHHIAVHAEIEGQLERAIQLSYRLPIKTDGWKWASDLDSSKTVEAQQQAYERHYPYSSFRDYSTRPFSLLHNGKIGLALAKPMNSPRIFRFSSGGEEGFQIEFDLGLSRRTCKFPGRAWVDFIIYQADPDWGLRAAAQKYYETYPQHFKRRMKSGGLYFYDLPVRKLAVKKDKPKWEQILDKPEEYGFAFCYNPLPHARVGENKNFHKFSHPLSKVASFDKDFNQWAARFPPAADVAGFLTRASLFQIQTPKFEEVQGRYDPWNVPFGEQARRALRSAIHDENGHLAVRTFPSKNRDSRLEVACNTDPEITEGMLDGEIRYSIRRWDQRKNLTYQPAWQLDGVDFDNVNGAGASAQFNDDFRSEHIMLADNPLTFDYRTRRPVYLVSFSAYEAYEYCRDTVLSDPSLPLRNRWMTGNLTGHAGPLFFGHLFDRHGGEAGLPVDEEGRKYNEPGWNEEVWHERLRHWRTMAYQKPVSILVNPGQVSIDKPAHLKWLVNSAALYGIFANPVKDIHTWDENKVLRFDSRYRDFFKASMPVFKKVDMAGWEPLTHAVVMPEDTRVRIERHGNFADGLFFTVFNTDTRPAGRDAAVIVNSAALKLPRKPASAVVWADLLCDTHSNSRVQEDGGKIRINLHLEPHELKVLRLAPAP